jgi:hypothetical protein
MSLIIPNYPDDQDSAAPIPQAVAWIGSLVLAFGAATQGQVKIRVNRSAAAAQAGDSPAGEIAVGLGQPIPGGGTFPTFEQFMAEPAFATAFGTIRQAIYQALLANHPAFADATDAGD